MKKYSLFLTALIFLFIVPLSALGEVFYVDTDNVGSPVAMWDAQGKKVWDAEYLPFGEEFRTTKSPQDNKNRFIGKEKDKETGLTYFGARYFDEKSGRFLTPDPVRVVDPFTSRTNYAMLENPQRLNRYAYGLNNPYRFVDPDGEFAIIVAAALGLWALDAMAPQSTNVSNSKGALDYIDDGSSIFPPKMVRTGVVKGAGVLASKGGMLGEGGIQVTSKTTWKGRDGARIDVENPNPGQRPGQIHYQKGKEKYLYDQDTKTFRDAPKAVNERLQDSDVQTGIDKARKILGESQ